jgi:predicted nucleotidyltransferase
VDACLPCLAEVARELLAPQQVTRIALLGDPLAAPNEDVHLLVEFARGAPTVDLDDWLLWQRELRGRCECLVELVSVNRLEEQVASDVVALTILYDSSSDG